MTDADERDAIDHWADPPILSEHDPRINGSASAADPNQMQIMRLPHAKGLPLPKYQSAGAAGLDLLAAVPKDDPVVITASKWAIITTGLVIALPAGAEGQVRPRSGLAAHHGVTVLNAPGTIDADYRGEVGVVLINHGDQPFTVTRGMRIAQLVISPIMRVDPGETTITDLSDAAGPIGPSS